MGWSLAQCPDVAEINLAASGEDATALNQLLQQATDCTIPDSIMGDAYHRLGILYYLGGVLPEAVSATLEAISFREKGLSPGHFLLGKSNHNLGVFYKGQSDYVLAIPRFRKAAEIYDDLEHDRAVGSRRELANAYSELRDYGLAHLHIKLALKRAGEFGYADVLAQTYLDFGRILIYQEEYPEARDTLKKAEYLLQNLPDNLREEYAYDEAACYLNLGFVYDELHEFEQSINYYQKAFRIAERLDDTELLVKAGNNIGVARKNQGRYDQAEIAFKNALNLLKQYPKNYLRAYGLNNLGDLAMLQNEPRAAVGFYREAIGVLAPEFSAKETGGLPTEKEVAVSLHKSELVVCLIDQAAALRSLATVENQKEHLATALSHYQLADRVLDAMRLEHQSISARYFWREEAHRLYEEALGLCYEVENTALAFYFMEKSKSVLLLDAFIANEAGKMLPPDLASRERELQSGIQEANAQLEALLRDSDTKREPIELANKTLAEAQADYQEYLTELSSDHPAYYQFRYTNQVITAAAARKAFTSPAAHLLHYFSGREYFYLLRLSPDQNQLIRVVRTPELDALLTGFSGLFRNSNAVIDAPRSFASQSHLIFETLLAPAWKATGELPEEIIIIPDGIIGTIPFTSLLTEAATGNDLGQYPYLIKKQQVRYAYSATILAYQAEEINHETSTELLFMAPFVKQGGKQPMLAAGGDMAEWLQGGVQGKYLTGEAANVSGVLETRAPLGILHFSTHASGGDSLKAPSVWLADSLLYLSDLYQNLPAARLVILSACETGTGRFQPGEGILNLANGFAYAGAKAMISTLWKVNDRATAQVLQSFYQSLLANQSAAASLRQAQLAWLDDPSVRSSLKSPYYWSGFTYWGAEQQALIRPASRFPWYLILVAGVVVGSVLAFRNRTSNQVE
jgi:CHAT domain-containing protein